jgi:hypothetical protein
MYVRTWIRELGDVEKRISRKGVLAQGIFNREEF